MAFELRINMDWPVDLLNEHKIKNAEIHGQKELLDQHLNVS
jgi:hypothetical protein